ncbi:hypothetical protein [Methylorubrum salsuginis]|uniref:hypothetical protein n=1 Tax=Methylorubrum salsuginis TaxID=414703 RepID=UPI001FCD7E08|nr:hypothetical protein [Methylorubrum salsuginis]
MAAFSLPETRSRRLATRCNAGVGFTTGYARPSATPRNTDGTREHAISSARKTAKPLSFSYLYLDEAEIARPILGLKRARAWSGLAMVFERSGLPKVNPMMGRPILARRAEFFPTAITTVIYFQPKGYAAIASR